MPKGPKTTQTGNNGVPLQDLRKPAEAAAVTAGAARTSLQAHAHPKEARKPTQNAGAKAVAVTAGTPLQAAHPREAQKSTQGGGVEVTVDIFHLRALELTSKPNTDEEGMAGSSSGRPDSTPQRNSP